MFVVYILACSDGTYHSGVTKNLEMRLNYHEQGLNADAYTYARRPLKLVFQQSFSDVHTAIQFEVAIQKKSTQEIELLVLGKLTIEIESAKQNQTAKNQPTSALIIPISYLGNIAYFAALSEVDEVILDVNERFQKQTYRNRCTICSANGLQNLIIPVIRPNGKETHMSELLISYSENWQKDHLKAIESAYRRAPFFEFYADDLFAIIQTKHKKLIDLTRALTVYLLDCFGMNTDVRFSHQNENSSIPMKILMNPKSRKNHKVAPYQQVLNSGTFEENVSLIDLLFNVGKSGMHQR